MKTKLFFSIFLIGCLTACTMTMDDASQQTVCSIKVVEETEYTVTLECVIPDDGFPVIERGIMYGLDEKTTNYSKLLYVSEDSELWGGTGRDAIKENVTGTIRETFNFSGREAFTTYFFRLYEQSPAGIRYSNTVSATTGTGKPDMGHIHPGDFTYYSNKAKIAAAVVREGDAPITRVGFCWNKTGNPTIEDETLFLAVDGDNVYYFANHIQPVMYFSADIGPLEPDQTYYVGAFAENKFGISYTDFPFFTGITDNRPALITLDPVIRDGSVIFGGTVVRLGGGNDVCRIGVEVFGNHSDFKRLERVVSISANDVPYTFSMEPIPLSEFDFEANNLYYVCAYAVNKKGGIGHGIKTFLYPSKSTGN